MGPAVNPDKTVSVGVASHIHAASKGGPRYDEGMTADERSAAGNGIWLCASCSVKIDRDIDQYSPDALRRLKLQAEERARQELGQRLPTHEDAQKTLEMALTGRPLDALPFAIQNIHTATARAMERLDPRFKVQSSFDGKRVTFRATAREQVALAVRVADSAVPAWEEKLSRMVEDGQCIEMPAADLTWSGSALIESMSGQGGTVAFQPPTLPAVLKLRGHANAERSVAFQADDMPGRVSAGYKSMTFKGQSYEGLFNLRLRCLLETGPLSGHLEIATDFARWHDIPVLNLPYFEQMKEVYTALADDWLIDMHLFVRGKKTLGAYANIDRDNDVLQAAYNLLKYTESARVISSMLGTHINLRLGGSISAEEHLAVAEVAMTLLGRKAYSAQDLSEPVMASMVLTEEGFAAVSDPGKTLDLKVVMAEPQTLHVFGQHVRLPPMYIELQNVRPRIVSAEPVGQGTRALKCSFEPAEGFLCSFGYQIQRES